MQIPEGFDAAVARLVGLLSEDERSTVQAITISPQASGEAPYTVAVPDEPVPLVGLATAPPEPATKQPTSTRSGTARDG